MRLGYGYGCKLQQGVSNGIPLPTFASASIDATGEILTFIASEDILGSSSFTLVGLGGLSFSTNEGTSITFSISPKIVQSDSCTLDYSVGDVRDTATQRRFMAAFTNKLVNNNSEILKPTIAIAVVQTGLSNEYLIVECTSPITGNNGFTFVAHDEVRSLTVDSIDSTTITFLIADRIESGWNCLLFYDAGDVVGDPGDVPLDAPYSYPDSGGFPVENDSEYTP